jgi:two-component system, OmpR family, response regulator
MLRIPVSLDAVSTQPRVLVIDDDEIVRDVMCELLREKSCEVFNANSPIGVTRLIGIHKVDVVVLDVMMPDISGDKLARLLRNNPKLAHLSIVLVSGTDGNALDQIAVDVQADAVVSKANIHRELANSVINAYHRKVLSSSNK